MLVLALPNEDFVPDDERAEQSGGLSRPLLQVFEPADEPAVDEDRRHRAAPRYGTNYARAVAMVEPYFGVGIAQLLPVHVLQGSSRVRQRHPAVG